MKETYKYLSMFATKEFLSKSNEELVKIYKEAKNEYDKSQAYSSLFVNNFMMLLKTANRYGGIDTADKAGMISEELIKTIESYDGSAKFITYMTTRMERMFLWYVCRNSNKMEMHNNYTSLNECVVVDDEVCTFQVEDTKMSNSVKISDFRMTIDNLFNREISGCDMRTVSGRSYRNKLISAQKIVDMLFQDDSLSADQIARLLHWYKKDKNGNVRYVEKPRNPDYIRIVTDKGITVIEKTRVLDASWGKVNKIMRLIKDLFRKYKLV